jgi:hypothetical protein
MSSIIHKSYDELFSLDNMFYAWKIFRRGKTRKKDTMNFEMHLEDNIFSLYEEIKNNKYRHSLYKHFQIFDNKKRDIYKAEVKDRIIHQIIYDYLLLFFNPSFISDSYASRKNKGQYKAVDTFRYFIKLASNTHRECYVLKCDVGKYFDNIDHNVLFDIIKEKVSCEKVLKIIQEVISSYHSSAYLQKGIPLGNITSQIFANVYLNLLDQYVKKELKCRFYLRYNDDLVFIFQNNKNIENIRDKVKLFVKEKLFLEIPFTKTSIQKISWGIDFLGFTILPEAILLRDKTKHKIYANINRKNIHSYFGILKHCDSHNLKTKILAIVFSNP